MPAPIPTLPSLKLNHQQQAKPGLDSECCPNVKP